MTLIVGHRGARNLWPENSLTGFRNALRLGVDLIEFDVHLTDAGELVVIHDALLDRTAEGTGPVRRLTPERRRQVRLKGLDEGIPLLSEVLEILAPSRLKLDIELKADDGGELYAGIVPRVVAEVARFGIENRIRLTSFDVSVLETCRREAPRIARLVSVNREWAEKQGGFAAFLDRVESLAEIVAIHHELMDAEWPLITSRLPLERLCVWTINDEAPIRHWLGRNIGTLTSDRPDLALTLRANSAA